MEEGIETAIERNRSATKAPAEPIPIEIPESKSTKKFPVEILPNEPPRKLIVLPVPRITFWPSIQISASSAVAYKATRDPNGFA